MAARSMIDVKCNACGAVHKVKDELAGKRAKCRCGAPITIPSATVAVSNADPAEYTSPPNRQPAPRPIPQAAPIPQATLVYDQPVYQQSAPTVTQAVQVNVHPHRGNSLAIASLVVSVLAVLTICVPFVSLPLAALGVVLAIAGVLVCVLRRGTGLGFSIAGGAMSLFAGVLAFAWGDALFGDRGVVNNVRSATAEARSRPVKANSTRVAGSAAAAANTDSDTVEASVEEAGPSFTAASQSVATGDIRIRITEVSIGKVPLRSVIIADRKSESVEPALCIWLELENTSTKRKIDYRGWMEDRFSFGGDVQSLEDEAGNAYKRVNFGGTTRVDGAEPNESIYPGKSIKDAVVFEVPVAGVETLRLTLPADAFKGEGAVRFEIPMGMVKTIE